MSDFVEVVYKATMQHDFIDIEEAEELKAQGLLYVPTKNYDPLTIEDVYGNNYGQ